MSRIAAVLAVALLLAPFQPSGMAAQTAAEHPGATRPAPVHAAARASTARPHAAPHAGPHAPPAKPAPPPAPAPAAPPPAVTPAAPVEQPKGTNTGLPLPRFASLKTDEVNLRTGPGLRYPIDWVYKRRDLPVQIEREFEVWRLIADADGVKGWVHQATLTGRRSFVVIGVERIVRAGANDTAAPVAQLKPGVVGRLRACDANAAWCQVQVGEYRGWLKRDAFWGIFPGEAVQ